ncbi:MAG: 6-phosphofructokinase, partial [Clostridia bacterium]
GSCLVALSEGIQDENGKYVSEYIKDKNQKKDEFSHINLEGAGRYLSNLLVSKTNLPLRNFELSLTQRSAAHLASLTDVKEAYKAGCMAVKSILSNKSGYMVTLVRAKAEPYRISFRLVLLSSVANKARLVPQEYINAEGNFVTQKFVDYALPLIKGESKVTYLDGLPRYSKISQIIKTR